jgi:hypothetical protein
VHTTPEGAIVGLEYDAHVVRCRALKEPAITWVPPAQSAVYVDVPGKGPGVSMDVARQFQGTPSGCPPTHKAACVGVPFKQPRVAGLM